MMTTERFVERLRAVRWRVWRLLGQAILAVAGISVVVRFEDFWQGRPFMFGSGIALVALMIGPWYAAATNTLLISLVAFYHLVKPFHTWGFATRIELDASMLYVGFLVVLHI